MAAHAHEMADYENGIYREQSHASHYVKIYLGLLVLLTISILGPMIELKAVTLVTAFGIALIKAYLVCAYFMHIKFEVKWVGYLLATCCVIMGLFFAGVSVDVMRHQGNNWQNAAAASETARVMAGLNSDSLAHAEILGAPTANVGPRGELRMDWPKHQAKNPANINALAVIDPDTPDNYKIPIDAAMKQAIRGKGASVKVIDPNAGALPTPEEMAAAQVQRTKLTSEANPPFTVDPAKAKAGEGLYTARTCNTCHANDDSGTPNIGPAFKGFWGRATVVSVPTGKKTVLEVFKANEDYFMDSVLNPKGKIHDGYVPQMQPGLVPDAGEREALLHYIVSLGAAEVVPAEPGPEGQEGSPTDGAPADGAAPGAAPSPPGPAAAPPAAAPAAAPTAAPAAALAPNKPTGANQ
jgi:caa(3)-type oxidase subunit IV